MSEVIKPKKKSIPKVVKDLSWNKWIGEDVARTKCLCCRVNEIKMSSFHCGHVIAESNGGKSTVDNLRPICSACNLSMGAENFEEFKTKCGFNNIVKTPVLWMPAARLRDGSIVMYPKPIKEQKETPEVKKEDDSVFWTPGMFMKGGVITYPKYIKWQKGTDSLQMGREITPHGYVYNAGVYERR